MWVWEILYRILKNRFLISVRRISKIYPLCFDLAFGILYFSHLNRNGHVLIPHSHKKLKKKKKLNQQWVPFSILNFIPSHLWLGLRSKYVIRDWKELLLNNLRSWGLVVILLQMDRHLFFHYLIKCLELLREQFDWARWVVRGWFLTNSFLLL